MNKYCKHKIIQFYNLFLNGTFDQDDVALFIFLVRDYTIKGSMIRELGDFLAHPDIKNKGIVLNSVDLAAKYIEENAFDLLRSREKRDKNRKFKGIGTSEELISDLKLILELADIKNVIIDEEGDNFREFVFCIIFLLGSCKLKHKDRLFELQIEYGHGISLFISYECLAIKKYFIILPVLFLGNVWTEFTDYQGHKIQNHIARRFEENFLAAITYEMDIIFHEKNTINFPKGTFWPLPNWRVKKLTGYSSGHFTAEL